MAFHHVALATTDLDATHRFYTEAMGFTLVRTVVAPTGSPGGGWAKHVFYDTGGAGMLAVWELHDDAIPTSFDPAISTGLGLPTWVNHIAFDSPDLEDFAARRRHWQEHGIEVVEIDHGWCRSIYATDPNGIMVEFCVTLTAFTPLTPPRRPPARGRAAAPRGHARDHLPSRPGARRGVVISS